MARLLEQILGIGFAGFGLRPSMDRDRSHDVRLITTAWNVLLAIVLVVSVIGWKGGKQLVTQSYEDAKVEVAEQKEEAEKKAAKQAARDASGRGDLKSGPNDNNNAEEAPSSSARGGGPDA